MWSKGSRRRPPNPPRVSGRQARPSGSGMKAYAQGAATVAPEKPRPGWPVLRRLRQRLRALWRWMIVRTVRSWFGGRSARAESSAPGGEVKQFPTSSSRWP